MTTFRPDIQGLRAVAVLAVLVYHVWPAWLPGGYVGVDVFFVISGFLITGLLVREFERSGTIRLRTFYARRIRRLLPAASLTLLAVAVAAWFWSSPSEWRDLATELVASALYVENWALVANSVDYLAQDAAPSPVQHYWSLSVEEQFYILWPLLMLGAGLLARRRGWSIRWVLLITLAIVTAASLGHSVYASLTDPAPGYFLTTTRIWELGLGGVLAIALPRRAGGRRPWWRSLPVRSLAAWFGIAAILTACWSLSTATPFPGYAALLPTLGAAGLLYAGPGAAGPLGRLLASRPMQFVGGISYSLYLWHWPIVVFYPLATGRESSTVRDGILIIAISIAVASASKWLIEDRFRHARQGESVRPYLIAAGLTATLVVSAGSLAVVGERRIETELASTTSTTAETEHPGAEAITQGSDETFPEIIPTPEVARVDRGSAYHPDGTSDCIAGTGAVALSFCNYGAEDASRTVVIVGDSHAVHWLPTLEEAARTQGWRVVGLTKSSCAFTATLTQYAEGGRDYPECQQWGRSALDWLLVEKPDLVIVSHSQHQSVPGLGFEDSQEQIAAGITTYADELEQAGIPVAVIAHTPWQDEDVPTCMAAPGGSVETCSSSEEVATEQGSLNLAAAEGSAVQLIDLQPYFCVDGTCPVAIGGVLVYRDKHHLTATYARTLAPVLVQEIEKILD